MSTNTERVATGNRGLDDVRNRTGPVRLSEGSNGPRRLRRRLLGLGFWLLAAPAWVLGTERVASAQSGLDLGLEVVLVTNDVSTPVFLSAPEGDDRLFVVELSGLIRIFADGAFLEEPFLDIRDQVDTDAEGGLLGLAFDPDYAENGFFYVYYTAPGLGVPEVSVLESRVSRFTAAGPPASASVADPTSETILFALDQPANNHNGGTVAIRDGWLYLALGDGGIESLSRDETQLFSKMVRLDLATESPTNADWEVWAGGFRNPFRFSFDRETGDLYIGDVGQVEPEEINVERADDPGGRDYGWNIEEGSSCRDLAATDPGCGDPALTRPVFEYGRAQSVFNPDGTCASVTGGSVYRGSAFPSLRGLYFFADWCTNRIWAMDYDRDAPENTEVFELQDHIAFDPEEIPNLGFTVAIAEDGHGELYLVRFPFDVGVYRLVPEPRTNALGLVAFAALFALSKRRRVRRNPSP